MKQIPSYIIAAVCYVVLCVAIVSVVTVCAPIAWIIEASVNRIQKVSGLN